MEADLINKYASIAANPENQMNFLIDLSRITDALFGYEKLIFVEHYLEGYTVKEISERYPNMSEKTIKRRLQALRRKSLFNSFALGRV